MGAGCSTSSSNAVNVDATSNNNEGRGITRGLNRSTSPPSSTGITADTNRQPNSLSDGLSRAAVSSSLREIRLRGSSGLGASSTSPSPLALNSRLPPTGERPDSGTTSLGTIGSLSSVRRPLLASRWGGTHGSGVPMSSLSTPPITSPPTDESRREREIRDVEQLQYELAAMEQLFQTILGQAYREMGESLDDANGNGSDLRGPPPASEHAIRTLPSVVVTPEDLIEETNRECCICFLENKLNERATRLPCGHLYHKPCVSEWLAKHCTCPVCRYELPTDDTSYERGRIQRMATRRPRMRRYELDRMPVRDLRDFAVNTLKLSDGKDLLTEKGDLIRKIVNSGKVDIVASPEPVEYTMSQLRCMHVVDLKNAMCDAGVFFDQKDVLEKEDMVQLFVQSGRVMVVTDADAAKVSPSLSKVEEDTENIGGGSLGGVESEAVQS